MTLQVATEAACKVCRKPIPNRRSTLQTRCIPCVIAEANAKDKAAAKAQRQAAIDARKNCKAERAALKRALIDMRPRSRWLDDAQKAVNTFVRARDRYKPCISCSAPWEPLFQAGHYLSRGARPELRFHLDNIHGQCVRCNMHLHGNQAMFRVGLVARRSLEVVERLEGPHPPQKHSIDELKCIRDAFRLLTKQAATAEPSPAPEPRAALSIGEPAICVPRLSTAVPAKAAPPSPASPAPPG